MLESRRNSGLNVVKLENPKNVPIFVTTLRVASLPSLSSLLQVLAWRHREDFRVFNDQPYEPDKRNSRVFHRQ